MKTGAVFIAAPVFVGTHSDSHWLPCLLPSARLGTFAEAYREKMAEHSDDVLMKMTHAFQQFVGGKYARI